MTYVDFPGGAVSESLAAAKADISLHFVGPNIIRLDAGDPVVFLAGVHVGCFELFATERVRRIRDLKGKTAGVPSLRRRRARLPRQHRGPRGPETPAGHQLGRQSSARSPSRLLSEGKIDAFLGFPPEPQELRAQADRPRRWSTARWTAPGPSTSAAWSSANREFVRKHPVATKRALRAILKAADLCALEPERAARVLVDARVHAALRLCPPGDAGAPL